MTKAISANNCIPEWATHVLVSKQSGTSRYATIVDGKLVGGLALGDNLFTSEFNPDHWDVMELPSRSDSSHPKGASTTSSEPKLLITPICWQVHDQDYYIEACKFNGNTPLSFAIRNEWKECLGHDLQWHAEPQPSNRTNAFLSQCRFPSLSEAESVIHRLVSAAGPA